MNNADFDSNREAQKPSKSEGAVLDPSIRRAIALNYGLTEDPIENERRLDQAEAFVDELRRRPIASLANRSGAMPPFWRRWVNEISAPAQILGGLAAMVLFSIGGLYLYQLQNDDANQTAEGELMRGESTVAAIFVDNPSQYASALVSKLENAQCVTTSSARNYGVYLTVDATAPSCKLALGALESIALPPLSNDRVALRIEQRR